MERKTSAYYQRKHRDRLREKGLVKKELWVLPEFTDELGAIERRMRQPQHAALMIQVNHDQHGGDMSEARHWSADGLHQALAAMERFADGSSTVELLDGADPSLHVVMGDYGDLPLFVAVVGEQVVVEALLWPVAQVRDPAAFNEEMLRVHKLFPLSTIGIETIDGDSMYIMFGALSANSTLSNVLFEIETLADNVIKVTEAYQSQLRDAA